MSQEFRERAVQLAQRKDGNPVHFDEACSTDPAVEGNTVGGVRDEVKGKCSPLHSPSHGNSNATSYRANRFNEQGVPDMAEDKDADRDRVGRFVLRDNNIEDVNMNMVGAKSGDKSVDTSTAKEASPSSRSGSKMDSSVDGRSPVNDEQGRQELQAVTEGLGVATILASRGIALYCLPTLIAETKSSTKT